MSFERVGFRRMYEDIIEQILAKLEEKELQIGDQLPPERDLSEMIGVSRGTLREAFRVLEQQGIIETKSGKGRYIAGLPKQNDRQYLLDNLEKAAIRDLLEAREVLETKIVQLACERATDQELVNVRGALNLKAGDNSTDSPLVDYDHAFHLSIAEAAHNVVFASFIQLNLELLARIRAKTLGSPERVIQVNCEHLAIIEALEERDVEKAKLAVNSHLQSIRSRIKEVSELVI